MEYHVFDFDKTLTNQDTIFGFFRTVHGTGAVFGLKRFVLRLAGVGHKLGFISNDGQKKIGVRLFLRGFSQEKIERSAKEYAGAIKLNDVYNGVYLCIPANARVVVSASFEEYLKHVFPNDTIVGSALAYEHGIVTGLKRNMYGQQKSTALKARGIIVDTCYTDSDLSDAPLLQMARRQVTVKHGKIIKEVLKYGI